MLLEAWCELLSAGHVCCLPVKGRSMNPTLRRGWYVRVRRLDPARVSTGDIVAFVSGDRLVAHRIVACLRWGPRSFLLEKGDGSPRPCRVKPEAIVGQVEEVLDGNHRPVSLESWKWTRTRRLAVFFGTLLWYGLSRTKGWLVTRRRP